jgi:SAM-dependent methyltransferase
MTETTNTQNTTNEGDLAHLLASVNAQSDWCTLDITRSDDHFILSSAETETYPEVERLPFDDNMFDLVTCRAAAHHLPDIYRFAVEARRVLKSNGIFAVYATLLPEQKRAAEYLNAFERLCTPSYIRAYSEADWRSTFLDADFTIERVDTGRRDVKLLDWAQGSSDYVLERLNILLAQAPHSVAEWLQPTCVGTSDTTFRQHYLIIIGKKNNG